MLLYGKCLNCGHRLMQIGKQTHVYWVEAVLPFDCSVCEAPGSIVFAARQDVANAVQEPPDLPADIAARVVPSWFDVEQEIGSVGTPVSTNAPERRTSKPVSEEEAS